MFDLWCSKWILYKCFSDKRYLVIFCCAIWCARVLHCITLRRHANPVCFNSYFYQTPKIVMADEHVLIKFSFVRKSGAVYWWGPCSRPSIWTLPVCCRKRPSRPTCSSHILRIFHNMCFSLKILNFCGASLEHVFLDFESSCPLIYPPWSDAVVDLHFTTATLALPRPNHMSLVCDGNQILGYISDSKSWWLEHVRAIFRYSSTSRIYHACSRVGTNWNNDAGDAIESWTVDFHGAAWQHIGSTWMSP